MAVDYFDQSVRYVRKTSGVEHLMLGSVDETARVYYIHDAECQGCQLESWDPSDVSLFDRVEELILWPNKVQAIVSTRDHQHTIIGTQHITTGTYIVHAADCEGCLAEGFSDELTIYIECTPDGKESAVIEVPAGTDESS